MLRSGFKFAQEKAKAFPARVGSTSSGTRTGGGCLGSAPLAGETGRGDTIRILASYLYQKPREKSVDSSEAELGTGRGDWGDVSAARLSWVIFDCSHTNTHTHTLSLSHTLSLFLSLSLSLSHTHTLSLSLSHSLSLTHTRTLSLSQTHTHTHTHSLSHAHTPQQRASRG